MPATRIAIAIAIAALSSGCINATCASSTDFEIIVEVTAEEIEALASKWGVYPAELSCDQVCADAYELATGGYPDFIETCYYSAPTESALGEVQCAGTGLDAACWGTDL